MDETPTSHILTVDSEEAVTLAAALSQRMRASTTEVVLTALRRYDREMPAGGRRLPPEVVRQNLERLDRAVEALWGESGPPVDANSNHDWLYDENGLPA